MGTTEFIPYVDPCQWSRRSHL